VQLGGVRLRVEVDEVSRLTSNLQLLGLKPSFHYPS